MKLIIDIGDHDYSEVSRCFDNDINLRKIIKSGKPYEEPTGDLISREALKKEIHDKLGWGDEENGAAEYMCALSDCLDLIDNAPAVEQGTYMTGEVYDFYIKGYKQGMSDFSPKKGEWINHRNDYGHNIADCSECGKAMQWHDEDEDGIPRYCWYCGAVMKGKNDEANN